MYGMFFQNKMDVSHTYNVQFDFVKSALWLVNGVADGVDQVSTSKNPYKLLDSINYLFSSTTSCTQLLSWAFRCWHFVDIPFFFTDRDNRVGETSNWIFKQNTSHIHIDNIDTVQFAAGILALTRSLAMSYNAHTKITNTHTHMDLLLLHFARFQHDRTHTRKQRVHPQTYARHVRAKGLRTVHPHPHTHTHCLITTHEASNLIRRTSSINQQINGNRPAVLAGNGVVASNFTATPLLVQPPRTKATFTTD